MQVLDEWGMTMLLLSWVFYPRDLLKPLSCMEAYAGFLWYFCKTSCLNLKPSIFLTVRKYFLNVSFVEFHYMGSEWPTVVKSLVDGCLKERHIKPHYIETDIFYFNFVISQWMKSTGYLGREGWYKKVQKCWILRNRNTYNFIAIPTKMIIAVKHFTVSAHTDIDWNTEILLTVL